MQKGTGAAPAIHPVILSGGSGTRLWPLSRSQRPKQMLRLGGDRAMIAATAARAEGQDFRAPVVVAGEAHERLVRDALPGMELDALILEPAARNTAPAIALAAHRIAEADAGALMLVMPSDHLIADLNAFHEAVGAAAELAAGGWLVTFGIEPTSPETGYGYIEAGEVLSARGSRVRSFHEKPDLGRAKDYLARGGFYWNAGIFLMQARAYLIAYETHAPEMAADAAAAYRSREEGADGTIRPGRDAFMRSAAQSIDYAVMEPAERKAVVPVSMGWSDIGSFAALYEVMPQDERANALHGDVIAEECDGSLIWAEDILVSAVGLRDLAVVATADAVIVLPREQAQDVKRITERLKAAGRDEADRPPPPRRK